MKRFDEPSQYDGKCYSIVISGHFQVNDSYVTIREQGMKDWLIAYTLSGEGYFNTPEGMKTCTSGDIVILKPDTPHRYGTSKGETWNFVWAHFADPFIADRLLPVEALYVEAIQSVSVQKRIYRAFRRIISDSRERSQFWHDLCLNSLREILMLLAQQRELQLDPRVEEALHYLSLHMRSNIKIDTLAKAIGLSSSRLSHLFREQTGHSIIDTLNQMRIHQAALLLEHTNRSASEVAYDVGFHNYNHFINQFRTWMGTTPSDYKKTLLQL
ncbi:helix-turn-helix domain-containing protein [Paenibacillus septentrionalis]|uniref:Helix-turn-helix domain-containing protein n=1 Tax=Paenibacillus septentrionalis TaxID=429342 RepID=A0ABW1UZB3_9BACL